MLLCTVFTVTGLCLHVSNLFLIVPFRHKNCLKSGISEMWKTFSFVVEMTFYITICFNLPCLLRMQLVLRISCAKMDQKRDLSLLKVNYWIFCFYKNKEFWKHQHKSARNKKELLILNPLCASVYRWSPYMTRA